MSKANRTVDSAEMERLRKKAEKIDKLLAQAKKIQEQIDDMKNDVDWLRYLGSEATKTLTQEENWELNEIFHKIIYAEI